MCARGVTIMGCSGGGYYGGGVSSPPPAVRDVPIMGWQGRAARVRARGRAAGGALPRRGVPGIMGCRSEGVRARGVLWDVSRGGGGSVWCILWDVPGGRGYYYGMPGRAVSGKF